jgi:aminopeptidase N
MEHAGATFLREEGVLFPSDPTAADIAARAETMLHEAAHQWFGDLVTMRWFDDLWLKEGFATFMAYKAFERVMPQLDAWKVFHLRTKPLAYLTDVTKGTTPIWQEIANLSAAKSAYGNIVYRKAPSMLRQAEFYLGPREFQRPCALRQRARLRERDVGRLGRRVRADVRGGSSTRGRRRGSSGAGCRTCACVGARTARPHRQLRGRGARRARRGRLVADAHEDSARARGGKRVARGSDRHAPGAGVTRVPEAVGKRRPAFVFANFEDYGYGRFLLDDESRAASSRDLGSVRDDFLRALLWGSLWESVREAEMPPARTSSSCGQKRASRETDEVMLAFILSRAQTAFTRYLSDTQRASLEPDSRPLYEGMMRAATPGQRITYFRTYREMATTARALKPRGHLPASCKCPA